MFRGRECKSERDRPPVRTDSHESASSLSLQRSPGAAASDISEKLVTVRNTSNIEQPVAVRNRNCMQINSPPQHKFLINVLCVFS